MQTFTRELREVMADPSVLPAGALSKASGYEDGTDAAFLSRLWRELYDDEPVQASPAWSVRRPGVAGGRTGG